jgi:hypothetical protein
VARPVSEPVTESVSRPVSIGELEWLRKLLASERRRHGQVETVLSNHIGALEQNLADLRSLYLSTLKLIPKENA